MKKKQIQAARSIELTDAEKQDILDDILRRNEIRRAAGIPRYNVEARFEQEASERLSAKYASLLAPYLRAAYDEVQGNPGLPGRIIQHIHASKLASQRMEAETGIQRPGGETLDLGRFVGLYQRGELNSGKSAMSFRP